MNELYNETAVKEHYDDLYQKNRGNKQEFSLFTKYFRLLTSNGLMNKSYERILDLGCGNGIKTTALCAWSEDVIGIDLSTSAIELAQSINKGFPANFRCEDVLKSEVKNVALITALGFSYFNEEKVELIAQRMIEITGQVASSKHQLILTSSTDFTGMSKSGWFQHSLAQIKDLEKILTAASYDVVVYFPHRDLKNYFSVGLVHGLKELIKLVYHKRRNYFFILRTKA